jgi:hypothetical protein
MLIGHSLSQVPQAQQRLLSARAAVSMTFRNSRSAVNEEFIPLSHAILVSLDSFVVQGW